MIREIPVNKDEEYVLDIVSYNHEGCGVGKIDNFAIFIPGAIKGEKVRVLVNKVSKRFANATLLEVIEESKFRTEPKCVNYEKCGGCNIQHMNYEGQLDFKKERVADVIARIGGYTVLDKKDGELCDNEIIINDVIGMEATSGYRNKVQFPVREVNGKVKIGFFEAKSHNIIDIDECLIQNDEAILILNIVRKWMADFRVVGYNERTGKGIVRHIMVRKGYKTGDIMVAVVTNKRKTKNLDELAIMLKEAVKGFVSLVQNINLEKTSLVLGQENRLIYGQDYIEDYIGDFKFKVSVLSFFQINPVQTEALYNKALEYAELTGEETVFDAYCGTGTISLFLSQKAKKVYGVEEIEEAIESAKENAKNNNINNIEFFAGKCEVVYPRLIGEGIEADVVLLDPPRKGCNEELLKAVAGINPARIVYVSCDPSTLARDMKILRELGYRGVEITPVDMFGMTSHVECVILMQRCGSEG